MSQPKRHIDEDAAVSFYHLISRVVKGVRKDGSYAFAPLDKDILMKVNQKVEDYFLLDTVSMCLMSNHIHKIIRRKRDAGKDISFKDLAKRHQKFHGLEEPLDARCKEIRDLRWKLNDVSFYMQTLLSMMARAYNLENNRVGSLWNPRFKSVQLISGGALSNCIAYVELNPVRAGIVKDPRDYKWSTWGRMGRSGEHPGYRVLVDSLRYAYGEGYHSYTDAHLFSHLGKQICYLAEMFHGLYTHQALLAGEICEKALLQACHYWGSLKVIEGSGGELKGSGFGRTRPLKVTFFQDSA